MTRNYTIQRKLFNNLGPSRSFHIVPPEQDYYIEIMFLEQELKQTLRQADWRSIYLLFFRSDFGQLRDGNLRAGLRHPGWRQRRSA
jgi:hypothetical protein